MLNCNTIAADNAIDCTSESVYYDTNERTDAVGGRVQRRIRSSQSALAQGRLTAMEFRFEEDEALQGWGCASGTVEVTLYGGLRVFEWRRKDVEDEAGAGLF